MPVFTPIVETSDPFALFDIWFAEAQTSEPADPNAFILAAVGEDGFPRARTLLMKSHDSGGFVFYTNQQSRKADQIRHNDKIGLCFYWKSLYRQVHVEGIAQPISAQESDAYFASRPRESQIGAWASQQSRPLESRAAFEDLLAETGQRFKGGPVPRPPHWGGYRVTPYRIEFWSGHPFRLHDRVEYRRNAPQDSWSQTRLFP